MTWEEYEAEFDAVAQKYGLTVERIPQNKESSGTREVQLLMANHPPSQPTSPSESSDTRAEY